VPHSWDRCRPLGPLGSDNICNGFSEAVLIAGRAGEAYHSLVQACRILERRSLEHHTRVQAQDHTLAVGHTRHMPG